MPKVYTHIRDKVVSVVKYAPLARRRKGSEVMAPCILKLGTRWK
jgi:hypothetical protein